MKSYLFIAIFALGFWPNFFCRADVLFDQSTGNFTSTIGPSATQGIFGLGQPISVTQATILSSIGFYLNPQSATDLKFMIWNGTNAQLLFSVTEAVTPTSGIGLIQSPTFTFSLAANTNYIFGITADVDCGISGNYNMPPINYSQNGFSYTGDALTTGNGRIYNGFANPMPTGETNSARMPMRLNGTIAVAPEPSSVLLILASAVALALRLVYVLVPTVVFKTLEGSGETRNA